MKNRDFEEYYLKYRSLVVKVAMDKIGNFQVAQEICQKVFIAFYTNMERVTPDFVKAWLIRCTNNAVIDYMRMAQTKKEVLSTNSVTVDGNNLVEKSLELYQEKMYSRDLAGRIFREVKAVNEQWYEVLILCCVDGMSYAEAANKLGVSESVLRARLYRARVYIKEKFGDEYKERKL